MLFLSALQRAWIDQSSKGFGAHRSLAFLNSCGVLVLPYRTPPRCRLVEVKQGAFYPVARQSGTVAASLTVYKLAVLSFLHICCCGRAAIGTALSCGDMVERLQRRSFCSMSPIIISRAVARS